MKKAYSIITILGLMMLLFSCSERELTEEKQQKVNQQLVEAVESGDARLVSRMLRKGADPDAIWKNETSVLHAAIIKGYPEIVKILVNNGADIEMEDMFNEVPLIVAVAEHETEIAEFLIESGADINHINNNRLRSTALMVAAFENDVEMLIMLTENGADLELKDIYGYTAIGFAVGEGAMEATKYLKEAGANLDTIGQYGNLYDLAIQNNDSDMKEYLKSNGIEAYRITDNL